MHASMGDGLYFDTTELVEDDSVASWENTRPLELQYHIEQLLKPENYLNFNNLPKNLTIAMKIRQLCYRSMLNQKNFR